MFNSKAVTEQSRGASGILCLPLNAGLSNNRQKLSTTQNKELQEIKRQKKERNHCLAAERTAQQLPAPAALPPGQHSGELGKRRVGAEHPVPTQHPSPRRGFLPRAD